MHGKVTFKNITIAPCLMGFDVSLGFIRHANTCKTIITFTSFLTFTLTVCLGKKTTPQEIPVRLKPSKMKNYQSLCCCSFFLYCSLINWPNTSIMHYIHEQQEWFWLHWSHVTFSLSLFYFCTHCKSLWTWASANCLKYNCSLITLAYALYRGQSFHLSRCDVINKFSGDRKQCERHRFMQGQLNVSTFK